MSSINVCLVGIIVRILHLDYNILDAISEKLLHWGDIKLIMKAVASVYESRSENLKSP